jgi:hypothetical protein
MLASRESLSIFTAGSKQLAVWAAALLIPVCSFQLTSWLALYSSTAPVVAYLVGFACVVSSAIGVSLFVPTVRWAWLTGTGVACVMMLVAALSQEASSTGPVDAPALCVLTGLLVLGTGLGALVGRRIQHSSHLLFVALVSGIADTLSVVQPGGISRAIAEEPRALALLALPWPLLGSPEIAPFLGVSDVVFTSLYLHASRAHALPLLRSMLALFAGFSATAVLVLLLQRPIPVLPLLGASFVLAQPRARAASAEDLRRGAWVLAALAFVIAAVFLRRSL